MSEYLELIERAGPSDTNREEWLIARRKGITGTDLTGLCTGCIRQQDLINIKRGVTEDRFLGNAYTDWGKQRELVISQTLCSWGIYPETRVFPSKNNERHLASPDGVGTDFDSSLIISEIKTTASHKFLPMLSSSDLNGHIHQVQWTMYVTGALQCLFAVEERLGMPGNFYPGDFKTKWIDRDDNHINYLQEVANDFLQALDYQNQYGPPSIDLDVENYAVEYLEAASEEARWRRAKQEAYEKVLSSGVSQQSFRARVTFTPAKGMRPARTRITKPNPR